MGGDQSANWQLLPELDRSVWTQALAIGERGRVSLPPPVRERLPWVNRGGALLGTIAADGAIRVDPWEEYGERTKRLAVERYELLPGDQKQAFALALMDRFVRLTGERGGRLTLPFVVRTHVDPEKLNVCRVVVRDGSLFLSEERAWQSHRLERIKALSAAGLF